MSFPRRRFFVASCCIVALLSGCHSGLLPAQDGPSTPAQHASREQTACTRSDAANPPPTSAAAATPAATIEGTIELAKTVQARAKPNDTIYVMARDAGTQKMVAVTRLFVPSDVSMWPLHFVLDDERLLSNVPVTLSVRIDKDGDATTKKPGDLVGSLAHEMTAPNRTARIVVDQFL